MIHGIVSSLGGRIEVETIEPRGARFVVLLPESVVPSAEIESDDEVILGAIRRGSILVVDDDEAIAALLHRFFERIGHTVRSEISGRQALALIDAGEHFDIVVTDQMMPEVTGMEIARAVRRCMPDTPVILCSGRDDTVAPKEWMAAGIAAFMVKPMNMIELADQIDRLLQPGPPKMAMQTQDSAFCLYRYGRTSPSPYPTGGKYRITGPQADAGPKILRDSLCLLVVGSKTGLHPFSIS